MNRTRVLILITALVGIIVSVSACGIGNHKGSATLIGVRYSDSLASGGKFKGCIQPGQRITTTDNVYWLPGEGNERQDLWQSQNSDADHVNLPVTSSDGQTFTVAMNVNFGMVSDCDTLDKYMRTIGLTRHSYFENDEHYYDGWITAMNYYISSNVISRAKSAFNSYSAKDMYPSTANWDKLGAQIAGSGALQTAVNTSTNGTEFYKVGAIKIIDVVPNPGYQKAIVDRQNAQTAAQTAKINQQAQVAQARADAKVAQAKAAVTRANLRAFPNVDAWLRYQVILAGGNPFPYTGGTNVLSPGQ